MAAAVFSANLTGPLWSDILTPFNTQTGKTPHMVRSIANAYRDAYGGLPKEVWVLSLALFVNRCGAMVLAFLTLYLTNKLGFTMVEAGGIFSVWGLGSMTGSWLGGKLVKPLGAIRTQIIGLTLAVPSLLLVPLFSSWWGVAGIVYLFSVFSESVRPANGVAVAQFTPPELHTRAFGLQRMAVNLGFSVGPAVGGLLANIDYVWLFVVDGITTGVGAIILLLSFGFRRYSKNKDAAARQKLAEGNQTKGSPLMDGQFVAFLLLMLAIGLVFFQFHATYPKYLEEHYQLDEVMIGLLFSVNTIIIVAVEMLLLNWVRRFSLLRTIGWGGFLACIGFGMLPLGSTYWFCILSMVVITVGEMFMFPLGSGYVAKRSLGRDQGMYMSWYAIMYSTAGTIAPLIGTAAYQRNPHLLWYVSTGVGVFAVAGFYLLSRKVAELKVA